MSARRFKFDLRPTFRRHGKKLQEKYAAAISAVGGGSLPQEIKSSKLLKIKRWGFVLQVHKLGQKLTWLVRGTKNPRVRVFPAPGGGVLTASKGQRPRPIHVKPDEEALARDVEKEAEKQFGAWDRRPHA